LIRHFLTFFDRHRYPEWKLTDEKVGWFLQLQEKGRKSLSPEQMREIEPLIWCQKCKEISLQQLVDEMSEWWSKGWGWMYPLQSTLDTTTDRLMKVALLRIRNRIQKEGFLSFFLRYPGIKQRMKDRRIDQFRQHVANGE
jgi:hypothetical protein